MLMILKTFTNIWWKKYHSLNENSLSCISINNQECKTRPQVVNVNGEEAVFFPFSIETSTGTCNDINYPYAKACVPDVIKNLNVKVFNQCQELMKQDL